METKVLDLKCNAACWQFEEKNVFLIGKAREDVHPHPGVFCRKPFPGDWH